MGVANRNQFGSGLVDRRVQQQADRVDWAGAGADLARMVDLHEIGHSNFAERQRHWVYPKEIRVFRVPHRDVPEEPFRETEPTEQPAHPSESCKPMPPLIRHVLEHRCRAGDEAVAVNRHFHLR